MLIITNADDLGVSPAVNEAIFGLMAEGLVTSATILANGPAVAEACARLRDFPRCSFGVHLNLTEFEPVGGGAQLDPLLDAAGSFNGKIRQVPRLSRLRRGIVAEIAAQVQAVLDRGVAISHLDSHHHVHTIPAVLPALKEVQKRFGIRKVRISMNVYDAKERPSRMLLLKKRVFNLVLRHWPATRTTGAFMGLAAYAEKADQVRRRYRSAEIMLHPGAAKSDRETALLRSLGTKDPHFRGSLASYHEL